MADGPEFCILRMRVFLLHFPRSQQIALLSSSSTLRFIPYPLYECPALKLSLGDKLGLSKLTFGSSERKVNLLVALAGSKTGPHYCTQAILWFGRGNGGSSICEIVTNLI